MFTIAQIHLVSPTSNSLQVSASETHLGPRLQHPSVLPKFCSIFNFTSTNPDEPPFHLAPIASWADRVRYLPRCRWTAPLHYAEGKDDYPSETCAFPGGRGWVNGPGKNLLAAMRNMTDTLQDWDGEEEKIGSRTN